jgi:N-acetylneuraminic acid mutarotase
MFTRPVSDRDRWASLAAILRDATRRLVLLVALVAGLAAALAGCGGSASPGTASRTTSHAAGRAHVTRRPRPVLPVSLTYRSLYSLPAPLRDPAYAALGGTRFAMLGGLDAADVSADGIEIADLTRVLHTGTLPAPQHDAQAALLGGKVYVFGGGDTTELDHILGYDPASGAVATAGALLAPQSDVAVTRAGDQAYIVGGFDGTTYLNTVVAWHPGAGPQVVAHLPVGLRYAAVAVADGGVLVIGGSTPAGASSAIYRFDLITHRVTRLGSLAHPVTHAEAATLGSSVYLIGGRGNLDNEQTAAVYAVDPLTGRVKPAGHLPHPTSDAAALTIGAGIVVAGGQSPTGTLDGVGELVPATAAAP